MHIKRGKEEMFSVREQGNPMLFDSAKILESVKQEANV